MVRGITVSREFGSGGSEVARILAERLEWKLIDQTSPRGTSPWPLAGPSLHFRTLQLPALTVLLSAYDN